MTTAAEYRTQIEELKASAMSLAGQYLTREDQARLAEALGIQAPEDEETRAAREELEALHLTLQRATRTFLPHGQRDAALRELGVPVPEGRVGRL